MHICWVFIQTSSASLSSLFSLLEPSFSELFHSGSCPGPSSGSGVSSGSSLSIHSSTLSKLFSKILMQHAALNVQYSLLN